MRIAPRGGRSLYAIVARLAVALALLCTPALAATVQYVYDELGRLVAVIDPSGDTTRYAYDEAGNLTSVARASSAQLAIVSFTPARGPVGTSVTIYGTGFGATPAQNAVSFNGTGAAVASASTTALVATVPAGATSGPISVTAAQATATSSAAFTVLVPQPPQISALSPTIVVPGAGFTVQGSAFEPVPSDNQTRINGATAVVLAATDSALTVRAPAVTGGKVSVSTANGAATSAGDLFIVPSPNSAADVGATARIAIDAPGAAFGLAASKIGLALFDGTSGTPGVKVTASGATFAGGGALTVYAPNGSVLAGPAGFNTGTTVALPTLPANGSFGVRVTSNAGLAGSVTLGAWKDISGAITPGASTDLSFTNPGQIARLSFSAASGDNLGVDLSSVTLPAGGSIAVTRDLDGAQLVGTSFPTGSAGASVRIPTISQAGSYTITVTPANAGTGSVHLTLWADIGGTLALGATNNLAIAYRNQAVRVGFSATQGQNLGVDIANISGLSSGTVTVTRDSDGAQLMSAFFGTAAGIGARIPTISSAGNYTVLITPAANSTGTLQLTLWKDVDDALSANTPYPLTIAYRNQAARLPFTGTAGQNLGVDITPGTLTGGGTLTVLRQSDGAQLMSASVPAGSTGASARIPQLSTGGAYLVVFTPNSAGTGTATVTLWSDVAGTLTVGTANNPTIAYRNQAVRMGFAATQGQNLGVDLANLTGFSSGTVTVTRDSDGAQLMSASFSTSAGIGTRIPTISTTGNYTVLVTPAANTTGTLQLTLWKDVDDALAFDTPYALNVRYRNQAARLPFNGTAGQNLGVDITPGTLTTGGTLTVLRQSDGAQLMSASVPAGSAGASARIPQLSADGGYTVVFTPNSAGTGTATVTLWRDVGGALNVGELNNITLAYRNQFVRMGFAASQGQNLGLDLSELNGFSSGTLVVTRDSDGAQLMSTSFNSAAGVGARIPTISQTGNYTVVVSPAANSTGTLKLRLWKDVDDPLTIDSAYLLTIAYRNQFGRLPFSGTSGQNLGLELTGVTLPSGGTVQVLRASDGAQLMSASFGSAGLSTTIPTLGTTATYVVVVSPNSAGTGNVTVRVFNR
jgi:large repetitive protein